jgi:type IV pilus assembly protein PilV
MKSEYLIHKFVDISRSRQSGVSLIESLVSLLVLALGVLGMLGVQLKTMSDNQTATHRVIAARMAEDIFERMKANTTGLNLNASGLTAVGMYSLNSSWSVVSARPLSELCSANACDSDRIARYDLWYWQNSVRNTLPGGNATTFVSPSDPQQLGVMVAWRLRNTDQTGDSAANTARAGWLNVDVAGGPTCPADSICLVAYGKP